VRPRLLPGGLAAALVLCAAARADAPSWGDHLARLAPAVVPVRGVIKIHAVLGEQSMDVEKEGGTLGVVFDASGLVLVSNTRTGGPGSPLVKAFVRRIPGLQVTTEITSARVLVGEAHEEREAALVVRDTTLDLAWVQVLDAATRPVPALDLATPGEVVVGRTLFAVARMGQGFDHAPAVVRLRATGRVEKPRPLWTVAGDLDVQDLGAVVFDERARPVGVLVTQEGVGEDEDAMPEMVLLPLDAVRKSLEAARPLAAKAR
jgi:hypothetical protein